MIKRSKLNQFTWAYITAICSAVVLIICLNKDYVRGVSEEISIPAVIICSLLGIIMCFFINRDKKRGVFKHHEERKEILILCGCNIIVFIAVLRIESVIFAYGFLTCIYFQIKTDNPFEKKEVTEDQE